MAAGVGILAGIKAGTAAVTKFLVSNGAAIGTGVAVGAAALSGGSFSNKNVKVSFNKGLLDKNKSGSSSDKKDVSKLANNKTLSHYASSKKHKK